MKKRYFALVMAAMVTVSTVFTDVGSATAYAAEVDTETVATEADEETESTVTEQQEVTEETESTEETTTEETVESEVTDSEADADTETTEATETTTEESEATETTETEETEETETTETEETEETETTETEETEETETTETTEDRDILPTGLAEGIQIDVGEISTDEIYTEETITELGYATYSSSAYNSDWDKYSTNYFYNQLDEEQQSVWDKWDEMCLEFLTGTDDATYESSYGYYRLDYVSASTLSTTEMKQLYIMFRISNPQYYFLMYSWFSGTMSGKAVLAPIVYTSFASGSDRKTATANVKSVVTEWVATANSYSSEADKVKVIHDTIANNVDYNDDFVNITDSDEQATAEQSLYTQSAYSVFCTDLTVCAGYAQAFEMVCNGAGIDCVAVTSSNHEWNKVRVNDSWYNVDVTWDDDTSAVYYTYFGRNDDYYDTVSTWSAYCHAEESIWSGYLPTCSLDTSSTSSAVGTWPTISSTTAAPTITVTTSGSSYEITMASTTSGADIYYTLDGTTPSVAATKSCKYTGTFTVTSYSSIKAMAAKNGQWDSSVTTGVTSTTSTSTDTSTSISYKVKFNGNGSTSGSMDTQTIVYGSGTKLTANAFKKKGYTFKGWNTKSDGSGTTYANKADGSTMTKTSGKTITLYAQWKKTKYTITYNLNGGKNNSKNPSKYYITTSTITLKSPTRAGYTFKGWYSDSKCTKKVTKIKKGSTGNKTLYAKWQGISYKVKFNGNGSTSGSMKTKTMTYGSGKKLTANAFKKKGYTFVGWNTKADGSGKSYSNKANGSKLTKKSGKTVTLYAQWKKTKYKITYNLNGGKNNSANPTKYTIKTATITLKKPTKKGYTFVGWYSDSAYKNKVTQIKKGSTGKVTLYAKWKKK